MRFWNEGTLVKDSYKENGHVVYFCNEIQEEVDDMPIKYKRITGAGGNTAYVVYDSSCCTVVIRHGNVYSCDGEFDEVVDYCDKKIMEFYDRVRLPF